MLKLKLKNFGHLIRRVDSLEKTLRLGKIEGRRKRGWQRMRWLDGITDSNGLKFEQDSGVGEGQGSLGCWSPWGCKESDMTEQLNWTELWVFLEWKLCCFFPFFLVYLKRFIVHRGEGLSLSWLLLSSWRPWRCSAPLSSSWHFCVSPPFFFFLYLKKIIYFNWRLITLHSFLIYFLLKDNCFTEFCCFLSNLSTNQP